MGVICDDLGALTTAQQESSGSVGATLVDSLEGCDRENYSNQV